MKCRLLTGALRVRVRTNPQYTTEGREAYNEVIDAINGGHDGNADNCPSCKEARSERSMTDDCEGCLEPIGGHSLREAIICLRAMSADYNASLKVVKESP